MNLKNNVDIRMDTEDNRDFLKTQLDKVTFPVIKKDDGTYLADSGGILVYLSDKYQRAFKDDYLYNEYTEVLMKRYMMLIKDKANQLGGFGKLKDFFEEQKQ